MRFRTVVIAVVIILILILGGYSILTFPRTVLSLPVSFTLGAESQTNGFDVPFLQDKVQVEVVVSSGTSLWSARIVNQGNVLWSHAAVQGEQTKYDSEWIPLANAPYNLTFSTLGGGSLSAQVTVTSKGGFW